MMFNGGNCEPDSASNPCSCAISRCRLGVVDVAIAKGPIVVALIELGEIKYVDAGVVDGGVDVGFIRWW